MNQLILLLLLVSNVAFAQTLNEDTWVPAQLQDSMALEKIIGTGFITDEGRFRLEAFAPQISIGSALDYGVARDLGTQGFLQHCEESKTQFRTLRNQKNTFRIRVQVPFMGNKLHQVVAANGSRPLKKNEQVVRLLALVPRVRFDDQSYLMRYGQIDPAYFSNELGRQLEANFSTIRFSGEAILNFTSYDDVACDFAKGLVEIGIESRWDFPTAKQLRKTTVSAAQLERIQKLVNEQSLDAQNRRNPVLSSAAIALALRDVTGLTPASLGLAQYLNLNDSLFDIRTNNWAPPLRDFENMSRTLDQLESKLVQGSSLLKIKFNGGLK